MSVLDGPRPDEREPGFGCTLSFGMLGPTRLYTCLASSVAGWESLSGGVILPHQITFHHATSPYTNWGGVVADGTMVSAQLRVDNPVTGSWKLVADYFHDDRPYVYNEAGYTNFQWGFTTLVLAGQVSSPSELLVRRVGEWQTPSLIWPGVAFADVV